MARSRPWLFAKPEGHDPAGKCGLPELGKVASPSDGKPAMLETASQNAEAPLKPISIPEEKPGQIADSAQDMVPQR